MVKRHIDWALAQQAKKKITLEMTKSKSQTSGRTVLRLIRNIEKGLPRDA